MKALKKNTHLVLFYTKQSHNKESIAILAFLPSLHYTDTNMTEI